MDIVEYVEDVLDLNFEKTKSKETKPYTEVKASQDTTANAKSFVRTTSTLILMIFILFASWKIFCFFLRILLPMSHGTSPFATNIPDDMEKVKAEKTTSTYVKRIDKLLENAKDEKEAVVSLKTQVEKLYEKRDQLTGYARAEINKQLTDVGKYIAMFEEVQNERKRTELNSHAKHVLDKVWD
jgi:hypothetical protein